MLLLIGSPNDQLRDQLIEILASNSDKSSLIPNYSGTFLYHSSSFLGRVWTCFWRLVDLLYDESSEQQCFINVIQRVNNLFQQCWQQAKIPMTTYKTYLQGQDNNDMVMCARRAVFSFNEATLLFRKVWAKDPKLQQQFPLPEDLLSVEEQAHIHHLVTMESICRAPLPFTSLEKLSNGETLEKEEHAKFQAWVRAISQSKVTVKTLHDALKEIIPDPDSLIELETKLYEINPKLYSKPDEEQIAWIRTLKSNDMFLSGGDDHILLGKEISDPVLQFPNCTFFEIQGKNGILCCPNNPVILPIMKRSIEKDNSLLSFPKIHQIDPQGRFAIVEALYAPLSLYQWQSSDKNHLTKEDRQLADIIKQYVNRCVKNRRIPKDATCKDFAFNKLGTLNYTRRVTYVRADSRKIRELIQKLVSGNLAVWDYIAEQTNHSTLFCSQPEGQSPEF